MPTLNRDRFEGSNDEGPTDKEVKEGEAGFCFLCEEAHYDLVQCRLCGESFCDLCFKDLEHSCNQEDPSGG